MLDRGLWSNLLLSLSDANTNLSRFTAKVKVKAEVVKALSHYLDERCVETQC